MRLEKRVRRMTAPFSAIPNWMLLHVCSFLDGSMVESCRSINKQWAQTLLNEPLWRKLCWNEFPSEYAALEEELKQVHEGQGQQAEKIQLLRKWLLQRRRAQRATLLHVLRERMRADVGGGAADEGAVTVGVKLVRAVA